MSIEAKLIALLLTVLGLVCSHWYAYHAGNRNGTNATLVDTQQEVIADLQKRNKENDAIIKQQAVDAEKANKDHELEKQNIRKRAIADANKRVPIDRDSFCGPARASKGTATGGNGQTNETAAVLPEPFAGNLRQLASEADETLADFRDLTSRVEKANCFQ